MFVDPVVTHADLVLRLDPALRERLPALAQGRVLVVDYWLGRQRALTIGDISVGFRPSPSEPRFASLDPIDGVEVLVALPLIPLLRGATLRWSDLFARTRLQRRLSAP